MELVPVTKENIGVRRRNGKNIKIIKKFLEMDENFVEVKDHGCKSALTAYNSLFQAARRMDCGVIVARRGDKVYLVKEEGVDELFI